MLTITKFTITNLFNSFEHTINFPPPLEGEDLPRIVIIVGRNGIGKTTILDMIDGLLRLDFTSYRKVPFLESELILSSGDKIRAKYSEKRQCIEASFNDTKARLSLSESGPAFEKELDAIEKFRHEALPILSQVSYQKVDIHRSIALRDESENNIERFNKNNSHDNIQRVDRYYRGKLENIKNIKSALSVKVKNFLQEAQIDYQKYFSSENIDFIPKIIKRLQVRNRQSPTISSLISRLETIKSSEKKMSRFGLSMSIGDINQLADLLKSDDPNTKSDAAIAALEAYVETLEIKHTQRESIAARLETFENLIAKFFAGKKVLIDYELGLKIETNSQEQISEFNLSSGEYHLLYMMVTALVSKRTGTTIAIDEPELSLHVQWQRELISTLCACASGASPLFILATHSPTIASEYRDKWVELT
ncbi:AAA family ATPase [Desulfogranum marinum]|uniref:AAA family ATPase n=1 Tax=Desulfogranum marinum TaxID=453220 RepID=UPI0029C753E2|nr:AAA family ATPase [Desulfogranum marinum]